MFLGYTYKYNGGCATSTELFPASIITQNEESPEACYALCQMTYNCKYFEYDLSGSKCHLHPSGITKGNGYPNVKCYKIVPFHDMDKFDSKHLKHLLSKFQRDLYIR